MKVAGIILAAGRSSRLGRAKALLEIDGETALARLARAFAEAGLEPVVVVASGEVLEVAREIPDVWVIAGAPEASMIDSMARGIEALRARGLDAAVIQPVDAPFTTSALIRRLLPPGRPLSGPAAAGAGAVGPPLLRARVPVVRGEPGHPVLVPARMFPGILARPEGGLRALIGPGGSEPAEEVPVDDARVLADLDTEADVARWLPSDTPS